MSDVAAWLRGLGLGRYAKAFEDHEIDLDSLPHSPKDAGADGAAGRSEGEVARGDHSAGFCRHPARKGSLPRKRKPGRRSSYSEPNAARSRSCSATSSTRRSCRGARSRGLRAVIQAYQAAAGQSSRATGATCPSIAATASR